MDILFEFLFYLALYHRSTLWKQNFELHISKNYENCVCFILMQILQLYNNFISSHLFHPKNPKNWIHQKLCIHNLSFSLFQFLSQLYLSWIIKKVNMTKIFVFNCLFDGQFSQSETIFFVRILKESVFFFSKKISLLTLLVSCSWPKANGAVDLFK